MLTLTSTYYVLGVKSTYVKNIILEIYTGAPLEHVWHGKKNFIDSSMLLEDLM